MLGNTKISYLSRLYHPTTGCSFGCPTCWARPLVRNRLAGVMRGLPVGPAVGTDATYAFDPAFHPDRLADPLRARRPQVIGVSFLGDWCDPGITRAQRFQILDVAEKNEQRTEPHTLIFATKQAEEMRCTLTEWRHCSAGFLLNHCWFGVSVSDAGDSWRVLELQQAPAAHRWVSYEPATGPWSLPLAGGAYNRPQIDLVIVGGESGPGARPMHPDWARSVRDQCAEADVGFYFKQFGEWLPDDQFDGEPFEFRHGHPGAPFWALNAPVCNVSPGLHACRVGTKAAGHRLDGAKHTDLPWSHLLEGGQ